MDNLPDQVPPYEPTDEELAEYSRWRALLDSSKHCQSCQWALARMQADEAADLAAAEEWAARHDAELATGQWYIDLCRQAEQGRDPGTHWRDWS